MAMTSTSRFLICTAAIAPGLIGGPRIAPIGNLHFVAAAMLRANGEVIAIGFDVLQVPRYRIVYEGS